MASDLLLLVIRARWFEDALIERLHRAGLTWLTRAHSVVALYLDGEDHGMRESELARPAGVSRQIMHEVVTALRAQGLLDLRSDLTNRSAKLIAPTSAGRDVLQQVQRILTGLEDELVQRIGTTHITGSGRARSRLGSAALTRTIAWPGPTVRR